MGIGHAGMLLIDLFPLAGSAYLLMVPRTTSPDIVHSQLIETFHINLQSRKCTTDFLHRQSDGGIFSVEDLFFPSNVT